MTELLGGTKRTLTRRNIRSGLTRQYEATHPADLWASLISMRREIRVGDKSVSPQCRGVAEDEELGSVK